MESSIFVGGTKPDDHIFINVHLFSEFFKAIGKIYFVFISSNSDKKSLLSVNIKHDISWVFGIPIDVVV